MISALSRWIDDTILELGREMRISYLPPLMVYMAAGIAGLTAIVGVITSYSIHYTKLYEGGPLARLFRSA